VIVAGEMAENTTLLVPAKPVNSLVSASQEVREYPVLVMVAVVVILLTSIL
jgi:hypothetical protein